MQARKSAKSSGGAPQAILHPVSRSLFSYWNGLRGEHSAPSRTDIALRPLAPVLPWIGIVERDSVRRRHRWRLAGTGIARLWGDGLAGQPIAGDWQDSHRRALTRALDGVVDRLQPFVARLKAVSADGEAVGIEFFAAPVEASDGASIQSLCSVVPFRQPHWLGYVAIVDVEVTSLTAIWLGPLPDEIATLQSRLQPRLPFKLIRGGRGA
jgi:hypothetical protein